VALKETTVTFDFHSKYFDMNTLPEIQSHALQMVSLFGITWHFLRKKNVKYTTRTQITNTHLEISV